MLRYLFLLSLVFSLNAFSDVFLSSPKIKLNAQNQRVIEFRIENERINDGDITLNEYKTNNPIDESFIEYTLINDFGNYHTFTIVLDDKYLEDYFSFKILIKENFAKDIFIYLPSKVRSTFNNPEPYKPERVSSETTFSLSKNQNAVSKKLEQVEPDILKEDLEENLVINKTEQIEPEIQQNDIFKSSEITTVWSMAEKIKGQNENISIYQVMWSIYLGNRKAFLNDNINLIRADLDISIPSLNDIESISFQIAKESILDMNESYASRLQSATKSLLVLTAPNVIDENKVIQKIESLDMTIFSKRGEKIYSIKSPNSSYDNIELGFDLKQPIINILNGEETKYIITSEESTLSDNNKLLKLKGNVKLKILKNNEDILNADNFIWNIENTNYLLEGNIRFENQNIILNSGKAILGSDNIIEFFNPVKYIMKDDNKENKYQINSENAYYNLTTESVSFKAKDKRVKSIIYF